MNGLYGAKAWFTRRLARAVEWAVRRDVSPDVFTAVGVLFAALGGGAVAMAWWPLALVGLIGRLAGANLDGAVARARDVARPFGFVVNEVGDRTADLLIMAGFTVLAWRVAPAPVVLLAAAATVAATLPTFAALAAAGAGAPRMNGGPFGKTERCAAVFVACVVAAVLDRPATALAVTAGIVIAGSLLTAVLRITTARRLLQPQGTGRRTMTRGAG